MSPEITIELRYYKRETFHPIFGKPYTRAAGYLCDVWVYCPDLPGGFLDRKRFWRWSIGPSMYATGTGARYKHPMSAILAGIEEVTPRIREHYRLAEKHFGKQMEGVATSLALGVLG